MVNFDNAATTFPKPSAVVKAVMQGMLIYGGNPGRSGHGLSIMTSEAVFSTRAKCAEFFGAETENTIFTQNCTHALNLAIKGFAENFKSGHIIISSLEHNSVARPVHALTNRGFSYSIAEICPSSEKTLNNFNSLIRNDTIMIICTAASNVTGQITPFTEIAKLCKKNKICFVLDCAQGAGILPIKVGNGINFICTAGHKGLYGPSGTGLLLSDGTYKLKPLMEGGTGSDSLILEQPEFTPDSLESGTVNTTGIIGLGSGIDFVSRLGINEISEHENSLCNMFIEKIRYIDGIKIYRHPSAQYAPIVSFNLYEKSSNEVAEMLSSKGFALRSGLHCASLTHRFLGTAPEGTIRFAPSIFNNAYQVCNLANCLLEYSNNKSHNILY